MSYNGRGAGRRDMPIQLKNINFSYSLNLKNGEFILNDLGRGCTFINGIGGFTEKQTTILYTVIGRSEFIKLKRYISQIDNNAFITVSEVAEVMGEGFKEINGE